MSCVSFRLTVQRTRALGHDGYFQVMDDPHSTDKLIKKFRLLYDEADIHCQNLEDIWKKEDKVQQVSQKGATFFKDVLMVISLSMQAVNVLVTLYDLTREKLSILFDD